jgi:ankyrin repeat protein
MIVNLSCGCFKDKKLFKDYLDKHLKPEDLTSGPDGSTALHVISDQGFDEFVLMFIALDNTMINKKNSSGQTALHLASSKGYTKVAQRAVEPSGPLVRSSGFKCLSK